MNNKTIKSWRESHIEQVLTALNITRKDYKRFMILSGKIHRIYEMACNGYTGQESVYVGNKMINEYTFEQEEKDLAPLYVKAEAIAAEKHLYIYFQTDPRGATIYLDKKPIESNSYTNAYCIY